MLWPGSKTLAWLQAFATAFTPVAYIMMQIYGGDVISHFDDPDCNIYYYQVRFLFTRPCTHRLTD